MIAHENLVNRIVLYATNNGTAYQAGRDVDMAITAAKQQLLREFVDLLGELTAEAKTELYEDWYENDICRADQQALHGFLPRVQAGQTEEVSAATYDYYLNQLPPLACSETGFYFGEPYDHDERQRPVTLYFYRSHWSSTGYYCAMSSVPGRVTSR